MGTLKWRMCLTGLAAMVLAFPFVARAQEESSSKPTEQNEPKSDSEVTTADKLQDGTTAVVPTPGYPVDGTVRAAGRAVPWMGTTTPLRFGPFSLSSLEYFNVYDSFSPAAGGATDITRFGMLRMNIVFDKVIGKSHFLFQYVPQLAMLNGHIRGNVVTDNAVSFGSTFELSPRLTLTLKDEFGRHRNRQLFPDEFLLIDRQTGGVIQTYFLENNGIHLDNRLSAVLNYKLSPRLVLTVAPGYIYAETHSPQDVYIVHDSTSTVGLVYALSLRRNIGVLQSVEVLHPVKPVATNGMFRTSGLFYSEQVTPSWWITGTLGIEGATYPGFVGTNWALAGSFTLLKTFTNSDLGIAYFRGSTLTNFLGDRQTDRVDVSYRLRISSRLDLANSIGYFHTTGADPRVIGKYAFSKIEYHLTKGFSLFGTYTRRFQSTSTQLLYSGDRHTFVMGFRWEPPALPAH